MPRTSLSALHVVAGCEGGAGGEHGFTVFRVFKVLGAGPGPERCVVEWDDLGCGAPQDFRAEPSVADGQREAETLGVVGRGRGVDDLQRVPGAGLHLHCRPRCGRRGRKLGRSARWQYGGRNKRKAFMAGGDYRYRWVAVQFKCVSNGQRPHSCMTGGGSKSASCITDRRGAGSRSSACTQQCFSKPAFERQRIHGD